MQGTYGILYTGGELLAIPTSRLWNFAFTLGLLCFLFVLLVFFMRNKLSARTSYVADQKRKLAPMISTFLFFEEDDSREEQATFLQLKVALREQLKAPRNRRILAETLLDLERDLSGTARQRLLALYTNLGLQQDAFAKLRSWHWQRIAQAIGELTQMQVKPAYDFIRPLINHRVGNVRQQAQIATVSLRPEGIGYFLDTVRSRISEWQQMKLMDVLSRFEDFRPPSFRLWLTSANPDVVVFSLRLIKYYRQNEGRQAIVALSLHPDDRIKLAAINCIREFSLEEALAGLKEGFSGFGNEVKMAVLDTLVALGTEKDLEFLQTLQALPIDSVIQSKALSCINSIAPDRIQPEYAKVTDAIAPEDTSRTSGSGDKNGLSAAYGTKSIEETGADLPSWEVPLFEDELNEEVLALCCQEELDDLFMDVTYPDREELNMAFLPLVQPDGHMSGNGNQKIRKENPVFAIEVDAIVVDAEESFRLELQGILDRIGARETVTNDAASETFDLTFIPWGGQDKIAHSSPENAFGTPTGEGHDRKNEMGETTGLESSITAINNNENSTEFKRFSIFEELFRYCDTESKLLLLDEVLALGGEKELRFLETLALDESEEVREKSRHIAGLLEAELQREENKTEFATEIQGEGSNSIAMEATPLVPSNDQREPLEFCFLTPKEASTQMPGSGLFDIDFTLTEDAWGSVREEEAKGAAVATHGTNLDEFRVFNPAFSKIWSKHHG